MRGKKTHTHINKERDKKSDRQRKINREKSEKKFSPEGYLMDNIYLLTMN